MVRESFLENSFQATFSLKANVLSVWKGHFSVVYKLLSDEVETIFWEKEAKRSKLIKSKSRHRKFLKKWFWSYLELNNKCSQRLKRAFFSILQNFWVTKVKPFSGKVRHSVRNYLNQNVVIGSFLENGSEATLSLKANAFEWRSWNHILRKRENVQNYLNQNLVIGSFSENCFEATLSSITNVLSVWNGHFSISCKFLSGEAETIFWETEAKR